MKRENGKSMWGAVSVLLFYVLTTAFGGELDIDAQDRYLLLATKRTSTMQTEIDAAASRGFRVRVGAWNGNEILVSMERVTLGDNTYDYQLLATRRDSTLNAEMNEAARAGFRYIPGTLMAKMQGGETIVIMERSPESGQRYEYLLLETSRTTTLNVEVNQASEGGFEVVGLTGLCDNQALLERRAVE